MAYGTTKVDVIQSSTANVPVQFNDGNGTQVGTLCRAWVNFNGIVPASIYASFNVSSVTRNSLGDYTINFTNAFPNINYAWTGGVGNDNVNGTVWVTSPPNVARTTWKQTGLLRVGVSYANTLLTDSADINISVFR